jgi:hypothetical protein
LRDEGFDDDESFDMAIIQSVTEVEARLEENLRKEKENVVCSSMLTPKKLKIMQANKLKALEIKKKKALESET